MKYISHLQTHIPKILALAAGCLALGGCAVSGGKDATGAQWFFASFMENTAEEHRTIDEKGFYEAKLQKDQVTGAKVIQRGILMREGIRGAVELGRAMVASDRAVQEAGIEAGRQVEVLSETNRSAEAMQSAQIAAEATQ